VARLVLLLLLLVEDADLLIFVFLFVALIFCGNALADVAAPGDCGEGAPEGEG